MGDGCAAARSRIVGFPRYGSVPGDLFDLHVMCCGMFRARDHDRMAETPRGGSGRSRLRARSGEGRTRCGPELL